MDDHEAFGSEPKSEPDLVPEAGVDSSVSESADVNKDIGFEWDEVVDKTEAPQDARPALALPREPSAVLTTEDSSAQFGEDPAGQARLKLELSWRKRAELKQQLRELEASIEDTEFELEATAGAGKAGEPEFFVIGEAGEFGLGQKVLFWDDITKPWREGTVSCVQPLLVTLEGWDEGFAWAQVKIHKVQEARGDEAFAALAPSPSRGLSTRFQTTSCVPTRATERPMAGTTARR